MAKSVAIRLGTMGKAQVKADWAEVRQAGEAAFSGISEGARRMGAANDAEFNRMAAGYDRAVSEMEAADRRRARAADKLNAIVPKSSVQTSVEEAVGYGGVRMSQTSGFDAQTKSAKESADAFRELLALEDQQQAKAAAIKAVLDPLAAAQDRYNAELAETRALQAAGHLTADELAQAEARLKKELDEVATGAHGAGRMGAMMGAQFSQMGQQIAAGGNVLQSIAIQLPDISVLLSNAGEETSKFASILGGPWGIAATTAIALAAAFVPKLIEMGNAHEDAVKKMEEDARQTEETRKVKEEFAKTETGVTQAIYDQAEALGKTIDGLKSEAQRGYEAAKANLAHEIQIRSTTKALLEQLIAQEKLTESYMRSPNAAREGITGSAQHTADLNAIKEAQGRLAKEDAAVAKAKENLLNAQSLFSVETGAQLADPVDAIKRKYEGPNGLIEQARKRAVAEGKVGDELQRQITLLKQQQAREEKTAQDARRPSSASGGSSNQAGVGDMSALLKQLFPGVRITSTTGGQHVKGSDHYVGRAIDFVPAGGMGQYSKAEVEKMLTDAGVDIRRNAQGVQQFFGPGDKGHNDHFHVAWQGSPSPESAQRVADRAQRERERAQEEQVRRQRDYDQATADLDIKLLQLRRDSLTDTQSIAEFEKQQIAVEADKYKLGVEAKVKLGDLTRAQADELENANAFVAVMRQALVDRKAMADKLRQEAANDDAISESKLTILQAQDSLAKTARERRDIELEILDQQKEEARRRYQLTIDLGKLGEATADQVKAAEEGLKNLDTVYGARRTGVMKDTAGPLEAYADSMDLSKQQIYEKVQGYAVDELEYFRKGLDDAITSKLGIKDPALASLIDLLIEQILIKPISDALASAGSETGGGGGVLASIGSAVSKFVSHLAGGAGGNAIGTEHSSGGYTWLAENGPELVNLPKGAKVTPAAQTRRILSANDNAGRIVLQQFDLTKAVMTEELMRDMQARSDASAQQMMQAGFAGLIDQNKRSYGRLLSQG